MFNKIISLLCLSFLVVGAANATSVFTSMNDSIVMSDDDHDHDHGDEEHDDDEHDDDEHDDEHEEGANH